MTRAEMDVELGRLVVLKGMPGDTEAYWDVLRDIPGDVFRLAVSHALKTRAWFPVPAELRHDADAAKPSRPIAEHPTSYRVPLEGTRTAHIESPFGGPGITVQVTEDIHRHCTACEDSGLEPFWCGPTNTRWPWMTRRHCGRRGEHGEHDWVQPCPCAGSNPVILKRKESQRERYATEPERVA